MTRRLLMGGGGSFHLPPSDVFTLVAAPGGWWSGVPDPVAYANGGVTYFGAVSGSSGDVSAYAYNEAGQSVSSFVLHAAFEVDIHASPAVMVRDDGKIIAAYSLHDGPDIIRRISTNPGDISAWGAEGTGGIADATYMSFVQLRGVVNSPIYWFFRYYDGSTGHLQYVKSTDGMATWSGLTTLCSGSSGNVPYWRIGTDWDTRFHVTITNTDRTDGNPSSLYHFYVENDTAYQSDGTLIATSGSWPILPTAGTLIKNASGGPVESCGVCVQGDGKPACALSTYDSGTTSDLISIARWTGSAWQVNQVASTNGLPDPALRHNTLGAIHPTNPDLMYMSAKVGSKQEMFRYTSPNSGTTWTGTQLTTSSANDNISPQVPVFTSALAAIWTEGTYTGPGYSMAIKGLR